MNTPAIFHLRQAVARVVLACAASLSPSAALADLAVVGTRHVYPAGQRSLTIATRNAGERPILVQVWLDQGDPDADPSLLPVPFVVTPSVFRMEPHERVAVSLQHTGEAMPKDRESLYWINFLNIPAREDDRSPNVLKLSHRFRMKVLYRPPGLPGSARAAMDQLRWTHRAVTGAEAGANALEIWNPSAYYVSLAWVEITMGGGKVVLEGVTVAPLGSTRVPLPAGNIVPSGPDNVRFEAPMDDGGMVEGVATLSAEAAE